MGCRGNPRRIAEESIFAAYNRWRQDLETARDLQRGRGEPSGNHPTDVLCLEGTRHDRDRPGTRRRRRPVRTIRIAGWWRYLDDPGIEQQADSIEEAGEACSRVAGTSGWAHAGFPGGAAARAE